MDDGFSAEKNEVSERFFFSKKIWFPQPKNEASEEATIFFFQKTDFPQKLSERSRFVFKKET